MPPETTAWTMPEAALVNESASTKTEVTLKLPPESIAAMVPLLVALLASIETEGEVFKASRINSLERALVGKGVRVHNHRMLKLSTPPEFAASIVALLVTLSASTKTEAMLKLPPEAVAKFRALTLPLLMTELPADNLDLCNRSQGPLSSEPGW